MTDLGLGSEIAITLAGIFIVNIILARITPFKYIFLTGQALLWGIYTLRSICLLLWIKRTSSDHHRINRWRCIATLMPAFAQPVMRQITGSDDIALGHFCTFWICSQH